jgi:hypothetical protein
VVKEHQRQRIVRASRHPDRENRRMLITKIAAS